MIYKELYLGHYELNTCLSRDLKETYSQDIEQ